ncbi:SpoIID/LytB domain-containing protein [Paraflavisolibacter sp. H34]|uniref:SpoIID/LytB domain-containing protein n=1 Tax=Huijunlia imazamoxiresistens TaxID=3127457 RepID=UPI00301628F0
MRNVILLACCAFLLCFSAFSQQSPNDSATLSFSIRDAQTGRPVQATVQVFASSFARKALTDKGGTINWKVPSKKHLVSISAPQYKPQTTSYTPEALKKLSISVLLDPVAKRGLAPQEASGPITNKAVVCGYVLDEKTSEPVAGALVKMAINGKESKTDADGFFKLESPTYTPSNGTDKHVIRTSLVIEKSGYKTLSYKEIPLFEDLFKCKINLRKGTGITVWEYQHPVLDPERPPYSSGITERAEVAAVSPIPYPAATSDSACTAPATIRVYHGDDQKECKGCNNCTSITQLSLETYVETGLDDEWLASWSQESLKAGAVAYRTYAAWRVQHPRSANYDISAYPCDQNWEGADASAKTKAAATATTGELLVNKSNLLLKAEYSAETNNTGCGDGKSGTAGAWPCIKDVVCKGTTSSGHGRGMCQNGSHRWGNKGKSYTQILDHYYNPGSIKRCNDTRQVDLVFLVDNTGSMGEEIQGVKNSIIKVLNDPQFVKAGNGTVFQLVTFKDNVNALAPTQDLNVIKSQVEVLVAEGGDDCPEGSVEAIKAVKDKVRGWNNGAIMLFTDASPHSGQDIEVLTEELDFLGIKLSVQLSGDCNDLPSYSGKSLPRASGQAIASWLPDSIPYADNRDGAPQTTASLSPLPGAIEAFSFMALETGGVFAFIPEINSRNPNDIARYENMAFNLIFSSVKPSLTNIEPSKGPIGGILGLTVKGMQTNFNATTRLSFSDTGITVKELTVLSNDKLQAIISIGPSVLPGFKDAQTITSVPKLVIDTSGTSDSTLTELVTDTARAKGLFQVINAPSGPSILSVAPASATAGQDLTINVTGIHTHFDSTSVLNLGSGITVLHATALSREELQADIRIASSALPGFRNVTVTTGAEQAVENVPGPFLVTAATDTCSFLLADLGPDKGVNLFYADSACTYLSASIQDSTNTAGYTFGWNTGDTTPVIWVCPEITTSYSVVAARGGCTFSDTVTVFVSRCPSNLVVAATSCSTRTKIKWREPINFYPGTIRLPDFLDSSKGTLTYLGSLKGDGYYLSDKDYSWPMARNISGKLGGKKAQGHLATLTSREENNFVFQRIKGKGISPWLGLYNTGKPGKFRWISGKKVNYKNWADGQPDNKGASKGRVQEPFVQMLDSNGKWNDRRNDSLPFLSEFEHPLLRFKQISGPPNGSLQKPGTYVVRYERISLATRQKDTCTFSIWVQCDSTRKTDSNGSTPSPDPQKVKTGNGLKSGTSTAEAVSVVDNTGNTKIPSDLKLTAFQITGTHYFLVTLVSEDMGTKAQVQVLDATGRMVERQEGFVPGQSIRMGHLLQPGFYFIVAVQNSRKEVLKVVKR